jgi:catechol 2,3-dioxygenase-like lactoylglutathione lyase family enzyme
MQASTINDIRTIGIAVDDQDAAVGFYRGTLGFEVRMDAPISPGMRWIEVAPAGAAVSLALTLGERLPQGVVDTGIRFTVPDAGAERGMLHASGVTVSEVIRWDGVPAMFTFDDPHGNRFYVVEAAEAIEAS